MIGYYHYFGDYARDTEGLSLSEHGAYRRLIDWYYRNERPVPIDWQKTQGIGRSLRSKERLSIGNVLSEYFELHDDGWHHKRIDKELLAHQANAPAREQRRLNEKERLKRHREYRHELFKALDDAGCRLPWNTKTIDLREMMRRLQIPLPDDPETPRPPTLETPPDTRTNALQEAVKAENCDSVPRPRPSPSPSLNTPLYPPSLQVGRSKAAEVCIEVRKLGFASANPQDAALQALLADGACLDDFRSAAAQTLAVKASNPWAYMLAVVKGRRRDAQEGPKSGRRATNGEVVRALLGDGVPTGGKQAFSEAEVIDVHARSINT